MIAVLMGCECVKRCERASECECANACCAVVLVEEEPAAAASIGWDCELFATVEVAYLLYSVVQ